MDPKQNPTTPTQLDPKLQETYDKVMATPTTPVPDPTAAPAGTVPNAGTMPVLDPTAMPAPAPTPTDPGSMPPSPSPVMPAMPDAATAAPTTVTLDNTGGVSAQPAKVKKPTKISPLLLVVGGIVLLAVYAMVWVKVFNLQVPFINP